MTQPKYHPGQFARWRCAGAEGEGVIRLALLEGDSWKYLVGDVWVMEAVIVEARATDA